MIFFASSWNFLLDPGILDKHLAGRSVQIAEQLDVVVEFASDGMCLVADAWTPRDVAQHYDGYFGAISTIQ